MDQIDVFELTLYPSLGWSNRLGHQSRLMIDNDGRHQSHIWIESMERKRLRPLQPWPANSPDLNPIENVFSWMKAYVEREEPSTLQELKAAVRKAWRAYPLSATIHLMDSMPHRLQDVIQSRGRRIRH